MNISGFRSKRKSLRQIISSRAYLVVTWGCLSSFLMSRAENAAVLSVDSITTNDSCPNHPVDKVLPKTVVSSNLRMTILVGLEWSEYHYLMEAVTHMFNANDDISEATTPCITTPPYLTLATLNRSPLAYTNARQQATDEMHDMELREQPLPWPGHLARLYREQSYPTGLGANKAINYIDLPMLAATTEAEGVDLRVIYLKRSARDILVVNVIHRHFQNYIGGDVTHLPPEKLFSEYALTLLTDATVMHSFLAEIYPAFIVYHDYGQAGDEKQAGTIANFVAPNPVIAKMYNSFLSQTWVERSSKWESFPFQGAEAVAARLQRELDAFEYLHCG